MIVTACSGAASAKEISVVLPEKAQHPYVCISGTGEAPSGALSGSYGLSGIKEKLTKTPGDYWYRRIKEAADSAVNQPVMQSAGSDRNKALEAVRKEKSRIEALGMMYLLTEQEIYLEKGMERTQALISAGVPFSDHYLYIGELAYTYAVAYDWLYNGLTQEQRDCIAAAVKEQCIDTCGGFIVNGTEFAALTTNLNTVCIGGITAAAMAVYEYFPEAAAAVIEGAVRNTEKAIRAWEPDGIYGEGSMYWDYGMEYLVYMMSTMSNLLGQDFGLSQTEGLKRIGEFPRFINGSSGLDFNFGDSIETPCAGAQLYWLAAVSGKPDSALPRWERRSEGGVYDLIWYDEALKNSGMTEPAGDEIKNGRVNIAVFRSENENGIYAAMKGGDNQMPHTDLDIGSFVIDAMGERWASDMGPEPYSTYYFVMNEPNSPRWTFYAKRAEAHNVPVINPSYTADQNVNAKCEISEFAADGSSGYALIDMTQAYDGARSVKRGMAVTDDKSRVIIRDEIRLKEPGEIYWMFHTKAKARLADGGRTVYLTLNGKTMKMTLLTGCGVFETGEDKPLDTSPKPDENLDRSEYTRIFIKTGKVLRTDISVLFTPLYLGHYEKIITAPAAAPLSEWKNLYGTGEHIQNGDGIKNRQPDVSGELPLLHFENISCDEAGVVCYEDNRAAAAAVNKTAEENMQIAFADGIAPGKKYTVDFNGSCFSFSAAAKTPKTCTDDFVSGAGPAGAIAYTNRLGLVVNSRSRETANYTVVSGDAQKYGADDTVIYMGGAREDIKLVYRRDNTVCVRAVGYMRLNGIPECDILIYGAQQVTDYNDTEQWRLLDTVKTLSSDTVGNGYNIEEYTAETAEPVNYVMLVMRRNEACGTDNIYLPQLREITLSGE